MTTLNQDTRALQIIDDYNNEKLLIKDIMKKHRIGKKTLYRIIRENKKFIVVDRSGGFHCSFVNTHYKKYNLYLDYIILSNKKQNLKQGDKPVYITKTLCEKYQITRPTYGKIKAEMAAFQKALDEYHMKVDARIQTFIKFRNFIPVTANDQYELFAATYHDDILVDKSAVVKAYCNLHFRDYYKNCIPEGKRYLSEYIGKYRICTISLGHWINYKKTGKILMTNTRKF